LHERPRQPPVRRGRRPAALAALLVTFASTVITGCSAAPPTEPAPTPAPSPSLTQEQQDDEAFHDIFSRYVDIDPATETADDLRPLLTGSALQGELDSLQYSADHDQRIVGRTTSRAFRVTERGTDPQGAAYMTGQACLDLSGTRVMDGSGRDVTPARDAELPLQMKAVRGADGTWKISDSVRNEDTHACS
jgi:hypothetical protein